VAKGSAWGSNGTATVYWNYRDPLHDAGFKTTVVTEWRAPRCDTGLMYYGARYYDPQIGTFVSPDTLVPDPTHVFDYNRYMYARGNPLKYNDPTGHCATTPPDAHDHAAHSEWAECWQYANTIWAQWDKTDDWNQMWPQGKEHFIKNVATTPVPASYFKGEFMKYMNSPAYKTWAAQAPSRPGHDPSCPECAGVYAAAAPANFWDCPTIGLDIASLGLSIVQLGAVAYRRNVGRIPGGKRHYQNCAPRKSERPIPLG